jgi:hypothetical protein
MAVFEFKNAQVSARSTGFSDTTQDVDLYVEKQAANCGKLVGALLELGFRLTEEEQGEIRRARISFSSETARSIRT